MCVICDRLEARYDRGPLEDWNVVLERLEASLGLPGGRGVNGSTAEEGWPEARGNAGVL